MAAAAPNVDLPSEAIVNTTGAAEQSRPQNSAGSSKFEVVVDSKVENPEEYVTLPKIEDDLDDEVIEPAYYYENMGVPVFTPVCFSCGVENRATEASVMTTPNLIVDNGPIPELQAVCRQDQPLRNAVRHCKDYSSERVVCCA